MPLYRKAGFSFKTTNYVCHDKVIDPSRKYWLPKYTLPQFACNLCSKGVRFLFQYNLGSFTGRCCRILSSQHHNSSWLELLKLSLVQVCFSALSKNITNLKVGIVNDYDLQSCKVINRWILFPYDCSKIHWSMPHGCLHVSKNSTTIREKMLQTQWKGGLMIKRKIFTINCIYFED